MTRLCESCQRSENVTEADVYVTGRIYHPYRAETIPYRGYLCNDHYTTMLEDGAEFKEVRKVTA